MKVNARLLIAALALTACDDGLPSPAEIVGFRVLAIRADTPEVAPGATVTLDALMVDPQGRTPTMAWYACIIPDSGGGFFGGTETSTSGGNGEPLSTDAYGGSCERRALAHEPFTFVLGTGPTATLVVPADLLDTDAALKASYGLDADLDIPDAVELLFDSVAGVNYTVALVTELDGERLETMKRVNVSLDTPNENPRDLTLHIAPAADNVTPDPTTPAPAPGRCFIDPAPTVEAGTKYRLTPVNVPAPQASYSVILAGSTTSGEPFELTTLSETYFYSYFTTVGKFAKEIAKAPGEPINLWTLPRSASGVADLWVVVRDGRGGVAFCHESLPIVPAGTASGG